MDFDKPKVYGDTFISDGLVLDFTTATSKDRVSLAKFSFSKSPVVLVPPGEDILVASR